MYQFESFPKPTIQMESTFSGMYQCQSFNEPAKEQTALSGTYQCDSFFKPAVQTKRATFSGPLNQPNMLSVTPEEVEATVAAEINMEMALYGDQEEAFVDQCLRINPVEYVSRPSVKSDPHTIDPIRLQKNNACRRSRMNSKIRKAKLKYQHQFIEIKLQQRAMQLQLWKKMVADAEANLLKRGIPLSTLKKLRNVTGMDKFEMQDTAQIRD